jgi:hypothetical protein
MTSHSAEPDDESRADALTDDDGDRVDHAALGWIGAREGRPCRRTRSAARLALVQRRDQSQAAGGVVCPDGDLADGANLREGPEDGLERKIGPALEEGRITKRAQELASGVPRVVARLSPRGLERSKREDSGPSR